MNKLIKEVTSVEVSNKLKKAGFYSPSYYCRDWTGAKEDEIEELKKPLYCEDNVNCYTATQLAEELPKDVHFWCGIKTKKRRTHAQHIHIFHGIRWIVNYTGGGAMQNYSQMGDSLADALANMMVYLLENDLIKK